ncbi:MAG: caspase family protein [Roseiflexaceae bacterium]|nr:caspase family protein [Roseiflexaceae bacterium]
MPFTSGHGLIIGVGTYAHESSLDVPVTADDARAIWGVLTDPSSCGYLNEQITTLTDSAATRQGMLDALDALAKATDADATVVFFFSGHGVVLADGTYALTTNDLRRGADSKILVESVVTESELLTKLRAIRAKKLLCLINACHSGNVSPQALDAAAPPSAPGAALPARLSAAILGTGRGRVIITACRADEFAYVGDGTLTVFPEALVSALHGEGVSNRRGFIGVYDLYDRVYELVTTKAPKQQPELTVIQGVGPFPIALFQGDDRAKLDAFDAPTVPTRTAALRSITSAESLRFLQEVLSKLPPARSHTQTISDNARVGTAIAGDVTGNVANTTVEGNQTSIGGNVHGPVFAGTFSGPVDATDTGGGDNIKVGDISGSSGVAIGRGAQSGVRHINTGGGDYAERDIDKRDQRSGIFGGTVNQGDTYSGNFQGAIMNIRSTLRDVTQSIGALPGSDQSKADLQVLITQLSAALEKVPAANAADAQAVAEIAKAAVEQAAKPQPNKTIVQISVDGLKQAAQNIVAVLPAVFPIAQQIAEKIMAFVR